MIQNYLKIAWRKLFKQKLLSFITVFGLGISLAACLLIALFIREELSYDNFYSRASRIVLFQQFEGSAGSGSGFASLFSRNIPQVEEVTRVIKTKALITNKNKNISAYENNFCFADSNFLKVFDLTFLQGNSNTSFKNPDHILISEKTALQYFSGTNAVGQTLIFNNKKTFYVTGVFKNQPDNSHLKIDLIAGFNRAAALTGQSLDGYWDNMSLTYLLLSKGSTPDDVAARLPQIIKKTNDQNSGIWKPALIPLRDIYLKAKLDGRVKAGKAIDEVQIFSVISLLVILLAGFNYVNITTAKAINYVKEVGMRKIAGATKKHLIKQFLVESLLYTLLAALLALVAGWFAVAPFNNLANTSLQQSMLFSLPFLAVFFGAVILFALLNGIYPALVLSSFNPADSIRKLVVKPNESYLLRRAIVAFQFSVTLVILIAVFVVSKQLSFIHHQYLGYDREQVLTLNLPAEAAPGTKQAFLNKIGGLSSVQSATICSPLPGQGAMNNKLVEDYVPKGKDVGYQYISADKNFITVFNIRLLQGKNFSASSLPAQHEFLINRSMSMFLELGDNAIGSPLAYTGYAYNADGSYKEIPITGKIIGVIEDYHQSDLRTAIEPMLIQLNAGWENQVAVKLSTTGVKSSLAEIQDIWKELFPGNPPEYQFLDDNFNETYRRDTVTGQALSIFAILTIIISCLGLFGLTAIMIEKRNKEIGIRKVMGASVSTIVALLTKDFLKPVLIAVIIASPIAWYAMNRWLQDFAYRITIEWWVFVVAGLIAILIAMFTIGFQAIKAAVTNPVKSLRTE